MKHNELISPKEAASRLGVAPQTILRWLRANHLRGYRCGRKTIRVRWSEVLDALRTGTAPVAGDARRT